MPFPNGFYNVTFTSVQPQGPSHQGEQSLHLLHLLQITNEATKAAQSQTGLRKEFESMAATAAKLAVDLARPALQHPTDL